MNQSLKNEILSLIGNLLNGLKLVAFQKVDAKVFRTGIDQMVMLVLFYCAITFLHSLILSQPAPEFNLIGLANIATQVGLILLSIYAISRFTHIKLEMLFVVTLSIWPWFYIIWAIIGKREKRVRSCFLLSLLLELHLMHDKTFTNRISRRPLSCNFTW